MYGVVSPRAIFFFPATGNCAAAAGQSRRDYQCGVRVIYFVPRIFHLCEIVSNQLAMSAVLDYLNASIVISLCHVKLFIFCNVIIILLVV